MNIHFHYKDLKNSYMVGDRSKDILAGINAGCKTIFINNNYKEANNCKPGTLVKLRTGEIGRVRQILAVLDFHPLGTKVNLDDENETEGRVDEVIEPKIKSEQNSVTEFPDEGLTIEYKGSFSVPLGTDEEIKIKYNLPNDEAIKGKIKELKDILRFSVMKTIAAFANTDGGTLYIGIKDTGTLEERLVGLTFDREIIENGRRAKDWLEKERKEKLPDEKVEDFLEMDLMTVLTKYLASDEPIAPLLETNFPEIDGIKILEIHVAKSPKPFFFKNLSGGREIKFNIKFNNESFGQRFLDSFYIRRGGSKIMLEKNQDFYDYAKNRFQKT